ncbi:hypothetical protein ABQF26_03775 [Mycolicibacterium elephantis]
MHLLHDAQIAAAAWTAAERGFGALATVAGIILRAAGAPILTDAHFADLEPAIANKEWCASGSNTASALRKHLAAPAVAAQSS